MNKRNSILTALVCSFTMALVGVAIAGATDERETEAKKIVAALAQLPDADRLAAEAKVRSGARLRSGAAASRCSRRPPFRALLYIDFQMIFISYSHVDAKWCNDLQTMAAPLKNYDIQVFSDAGIAPGASWPSTIQESLDKATVAVLLVSRHFLEARFIKDIELPYILKARETRGLEVLWVLVSACLYEKSPLQHIQAALPAHTALEEMSEPKRNVALKALCLKMVDASQAAETPRLDPLLDGKKLPRRVENLKLLARPATRRTEVFIRPDNSGDWYHQGPVHPGTVALTCHFGSETTKADTGFHVIAITTDEAVPDQHGKPTNNEPLTQMENALERTARDSGVAIVGRHADGAAHMRPRH